MTLTTITKFSRQPRAGLISACVVTRNACALLKNYLESLINSINETYDLEIIVVDNDSNDDTALMLRRDFPNAQYIFQQPGIGFTKGINLAISASRGDLILIATPSTMVIADAVPQLIQYLKNHHEVGVVGPKVLNLDGTTQYSSKKMPHPKIALLHTLRLFGIKNANKTLNEYFLYDYIVEEPILVTSLTMSLLLTRRAVFEDVGFLDENLFVWASDVDWCYNVEKSKWKQVFLPNIAVYHMRNSVSKKQPFANLVHYHRDLKTFYRKHYAKDGSFLENLFWEILLQIRFLFQIARYLFVKHDNYSYY